MKSLNSKGFTLIESLVTFAIIAVAGTMFLVGFYNVSIIASEGSLIKTTTNTLYNDLISENENVKLQDCSHVAFPSIFCQSAPLSDIHFHRV